jgi:hypothetical protein
MLHRGAFAAENGEGKQAANHSDGTENTRNCQFLCVCSFHKYYSFDLIRKRPYSATLPKVGTAIRSLYGSSVDAYWHPLTPEHGFPSLKYKTQGAPPQSAT